MIKHKKSYKKSILLSITLLVLLLGIFFFRITLLHYIESVEQYIIKLTGSHIKTVIVIGASPKVEKLIKAHLGAKVGDSIFKLSTTNMLKNLEKIGWIKHVTIHKKLPNIIKVQIIESKPVAIYHHNNNYTLIDKDGKLIENVTKNPNLPLVSGEEANKQLFTILSILDKFPTIKKEIHLLVYVRKRRWNIILNNKLTVKLPEQQLEKSLKKLEKLLQQPNIQQSVISIDLRLPDNIIIQGIKIKEKSKKIC